MKQADETLRAGLQKLAAKDEAQSGSRDGPTPNLPQPKLRILNLKHERQPVTMNAALGSNPEEAQPATVVDTRQKAEAVTTSGAGL